MNNSDLDNNNADFVSDRLGAEKKRTSPVLIIIPLMIVFVATIIPGLNSLFTSYLESSLFGFGEGLFGLSNYAVVLSDPKTMASIIYSVFFTVLPMAVALILGVISALVLPKFVGKARGIIFALLVLPGFLPTQLVPMFGGRLLPMFISQLLHWSAIAVIVCGGISLIAKEDAPGSSGSLAGVGVYIAGGIFRLLSPLLNGDLNGLPFGSMYDLIFEYGFIMVNTGTANAIWLIKALLQLLPVIIGTVMIVIMIKPPQKPLVEISSRMGKDTLSKTFLILGAIAIVISFISTGASGLKLGGEVVIGTVYTYFQIVVGVIVFGILMYGVAKSCSEGRNRWLIILFFILGGWAGNYMSEYLIAHKMGLMGTVLGSLDGMILQSLLYTLVGYGAYMVFVGGKRAVPFAVSLLGLGLVQCIADPTYGGLFNMQDRRGGLSVIIRTEAAAYFGGSKSLALLTLVAICLAIWLVSSSFMIKASEKEAIESMYN